MSRSRVLATNMPTRTCGSLKSDQDAEDDKCGRFATCTWNDLSTPGSLADHPHCQGRLGKGHSECGAHQRNERCGAFFIARTVRRGEIPFLRMEQFIQVGFPFSLTSTLCICWRNFGKLHCNRDYVGIIFALRHQKEGICWDRPLPLWSG